MDRFRFLALLSPRQRIALIPIFFLTLVSSVLEVFGLGLLIPFFKFLSEPESLQKLPQAAQRVMALIPAETPGQLISWMAGLLIGAFVFKAIIQIAAAYIQTYIVYRMYRNTASKVLANHLNAPITYLTTKNSAQLIRTVAYDTKAFYQGYIIPALKLTADVFPMLLIVITMFVIDPMVTLVAIFGLGVVAGGILAGLRKVIIQWGRITRDAEGMMMRWVSQGIGGIKEVQVLGAQKYITKEYDKAAKEMADVAVYNSMAAESPRSVLEVLVVATMVGLTVVLHSGGDPVSTWLPRLVFFGAASIRLAPAAIRIVNYVNQLRNNQARAESVFESLRDIPQHVVAARKRDDALTFTQSVEFRNVRVQYENAEGYALDGLNLEIPYGQTVALVGPTGAGKTTAIDALLGLIRPTSGAIYVDDVDITGQEQRWQPRLGYVPQFIYLADLNIRENVAFGVPRDQMDDAQVWKALEFSAIADFVRSLPNGLDTHIGERGVMLSGGQRQRIGIARALYFNPEMLIMDEATSALDTETEQKIADATRRLQGAVTMVLIAHRITTVRHADRIILMDQGKIADHGTFEELVERSELFRKLAKGLEGVED